MAVSSLTSEELHSVLICVEAVLHKDLCELLAKLSIEKASDQTVVYIDANVALSIILNKHLEEVKSIESLSYPSNQPKIFDRNGKIKQSIDICDLDTTLIQGILRNVSCFVTCKGKGKQKCNDQYHKNNSHCCQQCDHTCHLCQADPCQNCCMSPQQKCTNATHNGKCPQCNKRNCEECCLNKNKRCNHCCQACQERKTKCSLYSKALCSKCGRCLYCARLNPKNCLICLIDKELDMFEGMNDEKTLRNILSHWTVETGRKFTVENKPFEDFPNLHNWESLKDYIVLTQKRLLDYLTDSNFQYQKAMSSKEKRDRITRLQFILNNTDRREVQDQLKASMSKIIKFIEEEEKDLSHVRLCQKLSSIEERLKNIEEKGGECLKVICTFLIKVATESLFRVK